jgi:hypothetical protein
MGEHHKREDLLTPRQLSGSIQSLLGDDCFFHTKENKLDGKNNITQRPKQWMDMDERWKNIPGETPRYVYYMRSLNECRERYEKKVGLIAWDKVYDADGWAVRVADADPDDEDKMSDEKIRLMEEASKD